MRATATLDLDGYITYTVHHKDWLSRNRTYIEVCHYEVLRSHAFSLDFLLERFGKHFRIRDRHGLWAQLHAHSNRLIDEYYDNRQAKLHQEKAAYDQIMELTTQLPGYGQSAIHPVTKERLPVHVIIMDLNDRQRLTRDQIADWLDTLDLDLTFKDGV